MMNLPNKDRGCHHTGFARKCRDLVVSGECERWLQIHGKNPNTGEDLNHFNCVDDWMPLLTIENSQMQRQTGAAVESFRNEMVKANASNAAVVRSALTIAMGNGLLPAVKNNGSTPPLTQIAKD